MNRAQNRLFSESQRIRTRRARRVLPGLYQLTDRPSSRKAQPLIVIGMHRSGTSLTARILEAMGVDMGPDVTPEHHESASFVMRNRLLLTATKADWDHPQPFIEAISDPGWKRALSLLLEQTITAPRSWFLGLHETVPTQPDKQWGWKDPRSSLTWPLWLELYPEARFVLVRRSRPDVVASLVFRSNYNLRSKVNLSIRTLTEHGSSSLCEEYEAALASLESVVERHQIFDLRYENLVDNPTDVISSLGDWLGIESANVDAVAEIVRPRPPRQAPSGSSGA